MSEETLTTTTETTNTQTSNPAPSETRAVDNSFKDGSVGAGQEAQIQDAWKPFEKVKVMEKEHDVPAWLKGAITKENEAEAKRLLEKAYGIDYQTPKYEKTKTDLETLTQNHHKVVQDFSELKADVQHVYKMRDRGDLSGVLSMLQIPHEAVFNWVLQQAKRREMDPTERKAIEENERISRDHLASQDRYLALEQKLQGIESQQRAQQNLAVLQNTIANNSELSEISKQVDEKLGQTGSFIREVVQQGQLLESQGIDKSFEEVAALVAQKYKAFIGQTQNLGLQPGAPQGAPVQPKPTIPNIGNASAVTPVKRRFKSMDEIRKLADSQAIGG